MVDLSYCSVLKDMYDSQEVTGRTNKSFKTLGSLSTPNNLHFIRSTMLEIRPARSIEIGMAFGGSSLAIAATHRELGNYGIDTHVAIDVSQSQYWDDVARVNLEKAKLDDLVTVIEDYSSFALAEIAKRGERFDFAYIDGSHQFEEVFVDFYFIAKILNIGGVVLFDDCADPHIAKVLRFIRTNRSETFEHFPLERFLPAGKAVLRRSVASRLGKSQMHGFRKMKSADASQDLRAF